MALCLAYALVRTLANELGLNQTLPHGPTTLGPLELTTGWSYDERIDCGEAAGAQTRRGQLLRGWLERTALRRRCGALSCTAIASIWVGYVNVDSTNKGHLKSQWTPCGAINATAA